MIIRPRRGNVRYDEHGKLTAVVVANGYVMVRRPHAAPFVKDVASWNALASEPIAKPEPAGEAPKDVATTEEMPSRIDAEEGSGAATTPPNFCQAVFNGKECGLPADSEWHDHRHGFCKVWDGPHEPNFSCHPFKSGTVEPGSVSAEER